MVPDANRRDVLKGAGALGTATMLSGCSFIFGDSESEAIQMGILMGVTGGLEQLGPPIRNAAQLVPEQINNADIDQEIETQFEDTATDPQQGVTGAQALVDAGYPMIVGALSSSVSLQVAEDVTIGEEVVLMSPATTSPEYTDLQGDYTFRTVVPDSFQGELLADIAYNRLDGVETAATFAQDDAYGQGLSGAFAEEFEALGGTITDEVSFTEGQVSPSSQLETALSGDPDTMLIVAYPEDGVQIFQSFYQDFSRPNMPLLVSDGLQDNTLPDDVGEDMTNVSGTAPTGSGNDVEFFQQEYQDTYGSDPSEDVFVRQAYDAAAVLALAGAAAGENDGTAIRDQIRPVTESGGQEITPQNLPTGIEEAASGNDVNYQGLTGPVTFDDNGNPGNVAYEYFEFTDTGYEVVDTIEL